MLVYLNEEGKYLPPHIVGLQDNYEVADCCGIEDKTDLANGSLIAAAPDLINVLRLMRLMSVMFASSSVRRRSRAPS